MQRIIYLLVFFSASLLVLKPVWGIVTDRPVTETSQAAPVSAAPKGNNSLPKEKAAGSSSLYRPSLRSDGHLKLEPETGYVFASPFDEMRQPADSSTAVPVSGGMRLTGLAKSSRGVRAVIEQGQSVITLAEGETKAGITLMEIDEASRAVVINGPSGQRVLRLVDSQP